MYIGLSYFHKREFVGRGLETQLGWKFKKDNLEDKGLTMNLPSYFI